MYIGHYKAVSSTKEFYSNVRNSLDFPTQVEFKKERYLLVNTYVASTKTQKDNIFKRADELGIPKDVPVNWTRI